MSRISRLALKEEERDDRYIVEAPAGTAYIDILQKTENERLADPQLVSELVKLSRLVDCIQDCPEQLVSPEESKRFISEVFENIVNNVEFDNVPMNENDKKKYEQALAILYTEPPFLKTEAYHQFCIQRSEVEQKEVMILEMEQNMNKKTDQNEKKIIQTELIEQKALLKELKEALDAVERNYNFNLAEQIVAQAEQKVDSIPKSVMNLLKSLELLEISDPITQLTHVPANFSPTQLSEDNWIPVVLTADDIKKENISAAESIESDAISDDQIESIELEVQTVKCERIWFWPSLFDNNGWKWKTSSKPVSTGETDNNEGLIPAYIDKLIFARNLVIKGKSSSSVKTNFLTIKNNRILKSNVLLNAVKPRIEKLKIVKPISTVNLTMKPLVFATTLKPVIKEPLVIKPILTNLVIADSSKKLKWIKDFKILTTITKGKVLDQDGKGLSQVKITCSGRSGKRTVQSNTDGEFFLTGTGSYKLLIEKEGYVSVGKTVKLPLKKEMTPVVLKYKDRCPVKICLYLMENNQKIPFKGEVKILIKTGNSSRVERMNNKYCATFYLPPSYSTITITSSWAKEIYPDRKILNFSLYKNYTNRKIPVRTLTFYIYPAPILNNPEVQLLGFACKRVPKSPNSQNN